jgi:hypothetical protein
MVVLHYTGKASSEAQIARVAGIGPFFNIRNVDFPHENRWVQPSYPLRPDYQDHMVEYELCSQAFLMSEEFNGEMPNRYKGAILNIDPDCRPLWLTFAWYPRHGWLIDHTFLTYAAREGFNTHCKATAILKTASSYVDYLRVSDAVDLYEAMNPEGARAANRRFNMAREAIIAGVCSYGKAIPNRIH